MRALIRVALERDGCEVVEARDGAELIDRLRAAEQSAQPDVVVTDVQMPNFSGLGVLRALRQASSELPIILIAADTSRAVNSDAQQWRATVLKKPFRLEDLRAAVLDAARLQST